MSHNYRLTVTVDLTTDDALTDSEQMNLIRMAENQVRDAGGDFADEVEAEATLEEMEL